MVQAEEKRRKQMAAVLAAGLILLLADTFASMSTGHITIIRDGDELYMVRPAEGQEAARDTLRARVGSGSVQFEKKFEIALEPYSRETAKEEEEAGEQGTSARELAEYELRSMTSGFNSETDRKRVLLPTELESGETVTWSREKTSNGVMIVLLTIVMAFAVYRSGTSAERKRREKERESIVRQLPEFVNRLVLLLDAGLVLNTAFQRTVEESLRLPGTRGDYFYGKLQGIYESMRRTNGSMHLEFHAFARESGSKELLRISNIISDNVSKGASLNEKLEAESELLWIARKKNCEERGRLAETKLTLPLVLFLLVLIMITVAPALLEL